jgi:hypothetical protein
MLLFLADLRARHGGLDRYVADAGLDAAGVRRLRTLLLAVPAPSPELFPITT